MRHCFLQVHEQLKAKDSWGRTILTHAVLSGCVEVFDAAFFALREEILDYEVGPRLPLIACIMMMPR